MKVGNTCTKRFYFEYNELDSVSEFLEDMAAKGWELTSKTGIIFGFRKTEPRKVRISTELVYYNEDDMMYSQYVELCEAAGWKLIFDDGKLHFFETEDMDAEPIHSDPEIKLSLIHKKCRTSRIILPIAGIIFILLLWHQIYIPPDTWDLFQTKPLLVIILMPVLALCIIPMIISYLSWYKKAKQAIEDGREPQYKRRPMAKFYDAMSFVFVFVIVIVPDIIDSLYEHEAALAIMFTLIFVISIGFVMIFALISARISKVRSGNMPFYALCVIPFIIVLSVVSVAIVDNLYNIDKSHAAAGDNAWYEVYTNEIPFDLADLGFDITRKNGCYKYGTRSPIGRYLECYDYSDSNAHEDLAYEIYITDNQKARDYVINRYAPSDKRLCQPVDEPDFGANQVYYSSQLNNRWIVVYDHCVLKWDTKNQLTAEQKKVVGEKLSGI